MSTPGKNKKYDHVLVAEKALGKPLPDGALVHHWNEDRKDNRPENLAIFPGVAYHNLIHRRIRAYEKTGNADALMCRHCKEWSAPEDMQVYEYKNKVISMHAKCGAEASLKRYHARKGE